MRLNKLNPVIRGWGEYYKRARVRRLFHQLDGVGGASPVVAPSPTLALCRMANPSDATPACRAGADQPDFADSFSVSTAKGCVFVKAACGKTARAV